MHICTYICIYNVYIYIYIYIYIYNYIYIIYIYIYILYIKCIETYMYNVYI